MDLTGNTVLITGGGSGIGGGLASALHRRGNRVVIAGRRPKPLQNMVAGHPGMGYLEFDQADTDGVAAFVGRVRSEYPALNVVINNAAMVEFEDVTDPDFDMVRAMVATNLVGPIALTAGLLPALRAQPQAAVVNVTSALAFVPMAASATYCATKAALHSYTESLRVALRDSAVRVIEVIPPRVDTDAQRGLEPVPDTTSVDAFVAAVLDEIGTDVDEVVVPTARALRHAARDGAYDAVFDVVNQRREAS